MDNKKSKEELREEALVLMEKLKPIIARVNELLKIKNHNLEELQEMARLYKVITSAWPTLEVLGNFFGESAYAQKVSNYYHLKELAARGDVKAQKAVEELKPLFEAALQERLKGSES